MATIAVVSDTHAPRFWKAMPADVARHLEGVDLILHAGDVCIPSVLDKLAAFAPVEVVQGNNDGADVAAWGATHERRLEIDGVKIGMIHDSGQRLGRVRRMHDQFPGCDIVVYGHSHIPLDEEWNGFRCFNPGSPTDKRMQPHRTMGLIRTHEGSITKTELLILE